MQAPKNYVRVCLGPSPEEGFGPEQRNVTSLLQDDLHSGFEAILAELEAKRGHIHSQRSATGISGKGGAKEEKAGKRFIFVFVQSLQEPA